VKIGSIQINHPVYADIPERVLLAFLMIWDLAEDQDILEVELLNGLDEIINRIPLFEIPARADLSALCDLTDYVEVTSKEGERLTLRARKDCSLI
jgi:hypothetical protein